MVQQPKRWSSNNLPEWECVRAPRCRRASTNTALEGCDWKSGDIFTRLRPSLRGCRLHSVGGSKKPDQIGTTNTALDLQRTQRGPMPPMAVRRKGGDGYLVPASNEITARDVSYRCTVYHTRAYLSTPDCATPQIAQPAQSRIAIPSGIFWGAHLLPQMKGSAKRSLTDAPRQKSLDFSLQRCLCSD
jgi:hypothetical protein